MQNNLKLKLLQKYLTMQFHEVIPLSLSTRIFADFNYSKACENGHSKFDKTKVLMTNGSFMKVESVAEWCHWSIMQYV